MRTNKLIEKVRLGLSLPKVENRFSNENLLDLANDELQSSILPWIFSLREDFLVSFIDVPINTLTQGLSYPTFASGRTLKDLWYSENGQNFKPLNRIGLDQSWRYQEEISSRPIGFLLEGDRIKLLPPPSSTAPGLIRLFIHTLPNTLVDVSRGLTITGIIDFETISVSSLPSFFQVGEKVDIISFLPDYQVKSRSLTISGIDLGLKQITFSGFTLTTPISDVLMTQDLVCLEGETIETPIPIEINQILIQSIMVRVLESQNSPQQLSLALERFNRLKISLRDILTPRSENRLLKFRPSYPFLKSRVNLL